MYYNTPPKIYSIDELKKILNINFENNEVLYMIRHLKSLGINFDIEKGPWVAGGSVAKMILNKSLNDSDIDLFFNNSSDTQETYRMIHKHYNNSYVSKNCIGVIVPMGDKNINVQFISGFSYSSLYGLLGNFDFTVSQFVTDGSNIAFNMKSLYDLQNKILSINNIRQNSDALNRFYKYIFKGYTPTPDTLKQFYDIIKNNPQKFVENNY